MTSTEFGIFYPLAVSAKSILFVSIFYAFLDPSPPPSVRTSYMEPPLKVLLENVFERDSLLHLLPDLIAQLVLVQRRLPALPVEDAGHGALHAAPQVLVRGLRWRRDSELIRAFHGWFVKYRAYHL